jgi:hypothetical protein
VMRRNAGEERGNDHDQHPYSIMHPTSTSPHLPPTMSFSWSTPNILHHRYCHLDQQYASITGIVHSMLNCWPLPSAAMDDGLLLQPPLPAIIDPCLHLILLHTIYPLHFTTSIAAITPCLPSCHDASDVHNTHRHHTCNIDMR